MSVPPSKWPEAARTVVRTYGLRGLRLRSLHELRRRLGWFRAGPRVSVVGPYTGRTHPLAVDGDAVRRATERDRALERADRVAGGEYEAFRCAWRRLPTSPEEWLTHPGTGRTASGTEPWWRVRHLDPAFGDIKEVWEPGRFAWAYDLVRGWLLSGDDRYAGTFHEQLQRWVESSPPFRGPHWSCGQETAIRAAALLYAEANLSDAPSSDGAAMERIATVLAASGERIADAVGYAVSQRNNHAISEATGLVLLGVRFLEEHSEAERWLRTGVDLLEDLVPRQFARDGWYIQHSFNYHRLALDQLVLAERALRTMERGLSPAVAERIRASLDLLFAVLDPATGQVPNHGSNDGALVHPVSLADYRDFRPTLTAACATWGHPLPGNVPTDLEALAWLGLAPPAEAPPLGDAVRAGESGWAAARVGGTHVFFRSGRYSSRPGHLDVLHLDVRIDGREVVVDPGTYAYNAPGPWRNGLATAFVHNGPIADDDPPGVRGPRFLWLIWPAGNLARCERTDDGAILVGEMPGRLRREVRVRDGEVLVRDALLDPDASRLAVTWTLHPEADPAMVELEAGSCRRGRGGEGVRGWFSPRYSERLPAPWVEAAGGHEVRTRIGRPSGAAKQDPETH